MYLCSTIKRYGVYRQADSFLDSVSPQAAITPIPFPSSKEEEEPSEPELQEEEEKEK